MGWFKKVCYSETEDWFFSKIPAEKTPPNFEIKQIKSNEDYVHVFLKSMRIVNVRKGLSTFYPAVHSHIEFNSITGKPASFNLVTTPGNLAKLDSKNLDKIINVNKRLLGPVPYRGGDLSLEIGLFSVKEANLAEPFINLLTSMSTLSGVSFISAALPYVAPLEKGIELLTGSEANSSLEIGISTDLSALQTGYYIIMRANKNEINENDLFIDRNDFKLIDKNGMQIKNYPYMVFEISSSSYRDDWYEIPEVSGKYLKLQEKIKDGFDEAKDALSAFRVEVLTNPDLLFKDAKTIYEKVETEVNEILTVTQTSKKEVPKLKALNEYSLQ